jgi:hypothetical protein
LLRLPFLGLAVFALIVVAGIAAYVLIGNDGGDSAELRASDMTVEELYAALDQRIAASDGVLYLRRTIDFSGPYKAKGTVETWIKADGPVARETMRIEAAGQQHTSQTLTTSRERFTVDGGADADGHVADAKFWQCAGASIAASAILPCPSLDSDFQRHVEEGRWNGLKVIALVEEGTSGGESRTQLTQRTYLDADTLMPLRREGVGFFLQQVPIPYTTVEDFEAAEDGASVASDFFEPSAIGYQPLDPLEGLRAVTDLTSYWLGPEVTLPDGEVLVLTGSAAAPGRGTPYRLSLQYATKNSPHQPPFLTVMVFHRDMWERSPAIAAQAVTFGDVVVFVNAQGFPDQPSLVAPPNSYEFILSQLRPFEP